MGVVFPKERGTFYLFPLFLISLGNAVDFLIVKFKRKNFGWLVSPLFLIPVHFLFSLNLDYTTAYRLRAIL